MGGVENIFSIDYFIWIAFSFLKPQNDSVIFAKLFCGPVAQWIEQQPSKLWVERSSRSGVTDFLSDFFPFDS